MRTRIAATVCCLFLASRAAEAAEPAALIAFPTADSLRVQVPLAADQAGPWSASITPVGGGAVLWQGRVEPKPPAGRAEVGEFTISGLKPKLWSPGSPQLYELTVKAGHRRYALRTGFRSVESRNGQILLNGKPIFLKGLAINPPGRGVPEAVGLSREFAYDYVRFLRSKNFNCIRMNLEFKIEPRAQHWFDACDELGMLVYQGCYGSPPTGRPDDKQDKNAPPEDMDASIAAYRAVFETYARHPAVIIYILSNELPYSGKAGAAWHEFLTAAHQRLKAWDSTRLYIGNAGYGEGKEGDINDVHRYWGWYYNSFLTYYNLRRAHEIYGEKGAIQPFTFSECVGSFTSTLGEFNLIFRKQLGAQLHWTGHSGEQARDALAYQAFMAGRACESFRIMREMNQRLSGLMPFTILFYNWNGISRFEQMKHKPVADAMAAAYQPVLLSWECWTRQLYAGAVFQPYAHVVNDAEDFGELTGISLSWKLLGKDGKAVASGEQALPDVPYYGHRKIKPTMAVPQDAPTGEYTLSGSILRKGQAISTNSVSLFVAGRGWHAASRPSVDDVLLYDPPGQTASALNVRGLRPKRIDSLSDLPAGGRLIIGEGVNPKEDLGEFVRSGGRVLLLGQDAGRFNPAWLPAKVEMLTGTANDVAYLNRKRPTADQMNVNIERPDHPVFAGLDRYRFQLWSDYTTWHQGRPGFPAVYPVTRGFKLTRAEDLAHVAVLANYDRGLEGVALCEMFDGQGSVIFTGLDLVRRMGTDPVADRMLVNLVSYLSAKEHPVHPLIEAPIQWGKYPTEKGVVCGPLNGLVVNCRWVPPPTDPKAKPLPDNEGAWNTQPGDQYVPAGRRPFGPYGWNNGTATVPGDRKATVGAGFFHASLPPGRKLMVTRIENPSKKEGRIEIEVNGKKESFAIPAGGKLDANVELPDRPRTVHVRYTGDKSLVILETAFK